MYVFDKKLKKRVSVAEENCPGKMCYWPIDDSKVLHKGDKINKRVVTFGWRCGTRETKGCPKQK